MATGDTELIGHYIEDDALDALALTGMLNGESGISLTTSETLDDFEDWLVEGDLDFILVDIYRPDSLSLKDEIKRIRAHSRAPVFFVTGDEAKFYLNDAKGVGAEGVLEKETLTSEGLINALEGVPKQEFPKDANKAISCRMGELAEAAAYENFAQVEWFRFDGVQRYLCDATRAAAGSQANEHILAQILDALAEAQSLFSAYSRGQMNAKRLGEIPAPQMVRHLQRVSLDQAKQQGVKLVFQTTVSIFGDCPNAKIDTAVRNVLHAIIMGSSRGSTVRFNGLSNQDGTRLSFSSDAALPFDISDIAGHRLPDNAAHLGPTILMTVTMMLLELDDNHLTAFQRGGLNTLLIDIRDK